MFIVGSIIYWLLPISGKLAYIPEQSQPVGTWPVVTVTENDAGQFEAIVQDATPWTHVRLEVGGETAVLAQHGTQNADGIWQWHWPLPNSPENAPLNFYHSCETGCQQWAVFQTGAIAPTPASPQLVPTKLGLVFANPERDWHGRQGWDVEITYSQLADEQFWGIHDLAARVQQAEQNGLHVLVRVEYAQGQSIPPADDYAALDSYLRYLHRLARDERFANVYGFIIGSNFNTNGSNTHSPDNPVTPAWYARVFNGYGEDPDIHNNAVEVIRSENHDLRVLVGPVNPGNSDQTGKIIYKLDVPWLNYMNTMVSFIHDGAAAKAEHGIADTSPDGFAVQAFGRVNATELPADQRAQEPFLNMHHAAWGDAQLGFRVFADWLDIINSYVYTTGKPVYINASNTFDPETGSVPAENYPTGWLTNALTAINQEPQIYALCWFMDGFSHDEQWAMFSLTTPRGLLVEAAQEFDQLLVPVD